MMMTSRRKDSFYIADIRGCYVLVVSSALLAEWRSGVKADQRFSALLLWYKVHTYVTLYDCVWRNAHRPTLNRWSL